jgi:hypothetical protein
LFHPRVFLTFYYFGWIAFLIGTGPPIAGGMRAHDFGERSVFVEMFAWTYCLLI